MAIPVLIPAAILALVLTAVAYFFLSNQANRRIEDFQRRVEQVLKLLVTKAELLAQKCRDLEAELRSSKETNQQLNSELEATKAQLANTKEEIGKYEAELNLWRNATAGMSRSAAINVIYKSTSLSACCYLPKKAERFLERRANELEKEIELLQMR